MKSLLLVSLCFIVSAHCWGPITHLYFVCQSQNINEVDSCLNSMQSQYLFWGGLLPDGLTIDPFLENNNCSWSPHTHDPVFSGYLLLQSLESGDSDLVQFASGYGSHVISDMVGFYTDSSNPSIHGYMTKKYPVDWTLQWIFMAAVDSFVYHNLSIQNPPLVNISSKIANFLSDATYSYHAENPQYPALTVETITTCGSNWFDLVETMTQRSAFLSANNYNQDLVFFDKYGATTPEQAIANFELSNNCAFKMVANWISLVESTQDAAGAWNTIHSLIQEEFRSGNCMP